MPHSGTKINRERLIAIMNEHDLCKLDVANILDRKLTTVITWMSRGGVDIPDHALELLALKAESRTTQR